MASHFLPASYHISRGNVSQRGKAESVAGVKHTTTSEYYAKGSSQWDLPFMAMSYKKLFLHNKSQ